MNHMEEVWKDVDGFPGYKVSSHGNVIVPAGRGKPYKTNYGYMAIRLHNGKIKKFTVVHRLVCLAFLPNPLNYPQVNHKDANKSNNTLSNLEWCNNSMNVRHADSMGLRKMATGENHGRSKLDNEAVKSIRSLRSSGQSVMDIAKKFNVSHYAIYDVINRKNWTQVI